MSAKLATVATLLAAVLASTLAMAQDQAPAPTAVPALTQESAHQMPVGAGTDMAPFCARLGSQTHYYPNHARDRHIEGSATLECALNADSHIETCWIVSETSSNEEFGVAGLQIMCRVLNAPPSVWTRFGVDGDRRQHLRAPLNFHLNERR